MDFYLDFEATQFGDKVIAIGAVCGEYKFKTLCQPCGKSKLTPFITKLTGITKQDLAHASDAERAFTCLYYWISACSVKYPGPHFFHVYGNSDKNFILSTCRYIVNITIKKFMVHLAYALIDDAAFVNRYFHTNSIGLFNALRHFQPNIGEQDHDPLNDAYALSALMHDLENAPPLAEPVLEIHIQKKPKENKPYCIKVKSVDPKATKVRVFYSYREAFNFGYKIICNQTKNTNPHKQRIEGRILKAIHQNKPYANYTWTKEEY